MDWTQAIVSIMGMLCITVMIITNMQERTKRIMHQRELDKPQLSFAEILVGKQKEEFSTPEDGRLSYDPPV